MLYPAELRARRRYFLDSMYLTQHERATKFGCNWAYLGATEGIGERKSRIPTPYLLPTFAGTPHHL